MQPGPRRDRRNPPVTGGRREAGGAVEVSGFGDDSRDWSTEAKSLYDGLNDKAKKQIDAVKAKRVANTKTSLALADYAGKYSDPFYGTVEVIYTDGKLRLILSKQLHKALAGNARA